LKDLSRSMPFADPPDDPPADERASLESRLADLRRQIDASDWLDAELLAKAGQLCLKLDRRSEGLVLLQRALTVDRNHAAARATLMSTATRYELWEMNLPRSGDHYTATRVESLKYALRGGGPFTILIGGLVFGMLPPMLGLFYAGPNSFIIVFWLLVLWFAIMSIAYLMMFMGKIVYSSGTGAANPPEWPFPDLVGLLIDPFKTLLLAAPALGPALAWQLLAPGLFRSEVLVKLGCALLLVVGMYPFPMMYLYHAMTGELSGAFDPTLVFGSIRRTGAAYHRVALGWMLGALVIFGLLEACYWNAIIAGPLLALAVMSFMLIGGRALGLLYQSRSEDLRWH
jgi:hypothetical protein